MLLIRGGRREWYFPDKELKQHQYLSKICHGDSGWVSTFITWKSSSRYFSDEVLVCDVDFRSSWDVYRELPSV